MWKLWDATRPLTFNRYGYCMGNPVNYVDKSGHLGRIEEEVDGEIDPFGWISDLWAPAIDEEIEYINRYTEAGGTSFSEFAEIRVYQEMMEREQYVDGMEDWLLYDPAGQTCAVANAVVLFLFTTPVVGVRNINLKVQYGEDRDWFADMFKIDNNLVCGAADSLYTTWQNVSNPMYMIYQASYVLDHPNETVFRDPLEGPMQLADAFCAGENKAPARAVGSFIGSTAQSALAYGLVESCVSYQMMGGVPESTTETFYRTMSQEDYNQLKLTGEMPSTNETFISPTQSFSSNYEGVTVKFEVKPGTLDALKEIGVSNNTIQSIKDYGILPQVQSGWNINNAFFKGEGLQTNIGLGQGKAREIFNSNILNFEVVGGN